MNWRIVAVFASMIPIIIIVISFDIKLEDILAVGVLPFIGASLAMLAKLFFQGIKFAYISKQYLGEFDSVPKLAGVRMGSEFIKFTTPMFVGAEFVVIYYLHKKGIPSSKASWIAILDIVTDVFGSSVLSITAGILAIAHGAYVVAAVVLGTSFFISALWGTLFFLSSKKTFQVPKPISNIVIRFGKEKGEKYIEQSNLWMEEVCTMSRKNLRTDKSKKVFVNAFILSVIGWIFYGISFMIIAHGIGYTIEPFDSIMAVMGANAIGNLPITVGGSGLAEFGIVAYLNNLDPFNFQVPEKSIEWNAVIGWRIATYYVPIGVTWILLVKLALIKYTRPEISKNDEKDNF